MLREHIDNHEEVTALAQYKRRVRLEGNTLLNKRDKLESELSALKKDIETVDNQINRFKTSLDSKDVYTQIMEERRVVEESRKRRLEDIHAAAITTGKQEVEQPKVTYSAKFTNE